MSKMGQFVLELQEQANGLGYATVEDAIRDGYDIVGDQLLYPSDKAIEKARESVLATLDEMADLLKKAGLNEHVDKVVQVQQYIKEM